MGAPRIKRETFRMQWRNFRKYFSLRLSYAPFIRHWSDCRLNMMLWTQFGKDYGSDLKMMRRSDSEE